ncbi:FAD-dependent oxidoreductase [Nonomuraea sp. NN258]|uniref:NAD(P)/FAD-dependent oxidoreductase n=1 Tax=Nonomuraea antri TaxID=2730852 RepID=UPI00156980FD|nr:FAD-dependent oxidoreductase [Nonomuraea antri]NRQ40199.1 FAD-dependent oxidoreductase [Nonomuraea antri]
MTDILVLGAGYTGLAAAIRVATRTRRVGARVTLVNASSRFTERLRLHQSATGQRLADHSIEDVIAGTGIRFVRARVAALDPDGHRVRLAGGEVLAYDKLIYALGAVTDTSVPGVTEHAHTYDDHDAALRLAARLETLADGGTVVVAGGGLTGVESAAELAESHPGLRVVLLSRGRPGAMLGERAQAYLDRALARLGVRVRQDVRVTKVLPDAVELADGELIHSDATLWNAGTRGLPLAAESGLETDERGRIVVDPFLRSVSHPDVYAVGDAAAVPLPFGVLHGTCQSGIPTGLHAGDTLADGLLGGRPRPFRFGYYHQPVSLGRRDAVIQFVRPDDSPRRGYLTGRWAVAYKETVSGSPLPTFRLLKRGLVPVGAFRLSAGLGG